MKRVRPYFRRACAPAAILVWLALSIGASAQAPAITRWMDPHGRPKPLHSVARDRSPLILSRDLAASDARWRPRADPTNRICLIVHSNALAGAGAAVTHEEIPDLAHAWPRERTGALAGWFTA